MSARPIALPFLLALSALASGCGPSHEGAGSASPPASAAAPGLAIDAPWARASPAGVTNGAAYLTLRDSEADTLLGARVPPAVAAGAEVHEVVVDPAGRRSMRPVSTLPLAPGRPLVFEPGSHHVMLTGLARPLVAGETLALTLRFAQHPETTVWVPVRER